MKGLKKQMEADKAPPPVVEVPVVAKAGKPGKRAGTRMIAGHFSEEFAHRVGGLAHERRTTVQALIGEGLDYVLSRSGYEPGGER